jgi:macrolide-specific efflux system membrane fusion protein
MGTMKKNLIIVIALALAAWALFHFWPHSTVQAFSYQPVSVTRGDLSKAVEAAGNVAPQNRVDLRPPFSGRLEEVLVNEGDWVKKGQILAWLSSSERASLLDAARAQGPEELKKWQELYRPTPMLSPISGTLIARNFEPGQGVGGTDAVLAVSDRLIVKAAVDETDIAQVRVGQPAKITLDAYPGQPFDGRAVHIAYDAVIVSNVTNYTVEVAASKVPSFMRSGMTATVDFYTEKHPDVLLIPNDAIQPRKEKAPGGQGNSMADALRKDLAGGAAGSDAGGQGGQRGQHAGGWNGQRNPNWNGQRQGGKDTAGAGHGRHATVLVPGPVGANGKAGDPVEKEVRLGMSDGKNSEVLEGLNEGDTVLLKTIALPTAATGTNPFMPARPTANPNGGRRPS